MWLCDLFGVEAARIKSAVCVEVRGVCVAKYVARVDIPICTFVYVQYIYIYVADFLFRSPFEANLARQKPK